MALMAFLLTHNHHRPILPSFESEFSLTLQPQMSRKHKKATMAWEDPDMLLKKKLGREEYCQRMLTSLILGGTYPLWNSRNRPSENGMQFLCRLHEKAFGTPLSGQCDFVDEFTLPSKHDNKSDGVPDYALLSVKNLLIIELKTELTSHKKGQLPYYAELAAHHYPEHQIKIIYITPDMDTIVSASLGNVPVKHLFWREIASMVQQRWGNSVHEEERRLNTALQREIASLKTPARRFRRHAQIIREAIRLSPMVQETGVQKGIEVTVGGLEDLMDLRIRIRDALARTDGVNNVRPWIWYAETSGGTALTTQGQEVGCELRLSRYQNTHRQ